MESVDRGEEFFTEEVYDADGSDASDQLLWMRDQVKFQSVENGGIVMIPADELEGGGDAFWGDGDEGNAEYTGNEGATRETTYSTYIMNAYSE